MERVLRVVRVVWVAEVWVALALLILNFLAMFVGSYWLCEWPWQPFGDFNPHCNPNYVDYAD